MNEQLDMYEVEVGQSNRGIWYCKSIQINNSKSILLAQELDTLIQDVDNVLDKHNKVVEVSEPKQQ